MIVVVAAYLARALFKVLGLHDAAIFGKFNHHLVVVVAFRHSIVFVQNERESNGTVYQQKQQQMLKSNVRRFREAIVRVIF